LNFEFLSIEEVAELNKFVESPAWPVFRKWLDFTKAEFAVAVLEETRPADAYHEASGQVKAFKSLSLDFEPGVKQELEWRSQRKKR
jgi:hypothetical protein